MEMHLEHRVRQYKLGKGSKLEELEEHHLVPSLQLSHFVTMMHSATDNFSWETNVAVTTEIHCNSSSFKRTPKRLKLQHEKYKI